ncbi:MAG: hypothetical protein Q8909_08775 [Bacteroidota bacterium]|nr:hypothetical protein [Bacteroidota bacterium]
MTKKLVLIVLVLSSLPIIIKAEDEKKSYFTATVNYSTNSVWEGRSDSIITPYIGTTLGYHFKFGGYINGTLNFYPNRKDNVLDQSILQAGYDFTLIKDKLKGALSYSAYFNSKYSTQVRSEIQGVTSAGLSYDAKIFEWSVNADYDFGNKSDFTLTSSLSRWIQVFSKGNHTLSVNPTVSGFAGTQNLYAEYLKNRVNKIKLHGKKAGTTAASTTSTVQTSEYSQFNLVDIDLALPVGYSYHDLSFSVTPTYAIPLHVQSGEFTSHPFYLNFSVEYKF